MARWIVPINGSGEITAFPVNVPIDADVESTAMIMGYAKGAYKVVLDADIKPIYDLWVAGELPITPPGQGGGGSGGGKVYVESDSTQSVIGWDALNTKVNNRITKVATPTVGNIPTLDANGELVDSGKDFTILDAKADKVSSPVVDNFVSLDANGNIKDSGKKPGDFIPSTKVYNEFLGTISKASLPYTSILDLVLNRPNTSFYMYTADLIAYGDAPSDMVSGYLVYITVNYAPTITFVEIRQADNIWYRSVSVTSWREVTWYKYATMGDLSSRPFNLANINNNYGIAITTAAGATLEGQDFIVGVQGGSIYLGAGKPIARITIVKIG